MPWFQQARWRPCRVSRGHGNAQQSCRGEGAPLSQWVLKARSPPWWVQKAEHRTKELRAFTLLGFGLTWDPPLLLTSHFFFLQWECLFHACPTTAFWKYITYLVSQVHSWRVIFFQDESYPKSLKGVKTFGAVGME